MKPKRIEILGVPVDCVTMAGARQYADHVIREGLGPQAVIAINPEKIIKAGADPGLLACIRSAGLLIPDGIGAVFAAKWSGVKEIERVPGSELMPELCALAAENGYGVFLYGAKPEVVEQTADKLARDYPGLKVAGFQHGYLPEEEMPELVERINQSGARIIFIALGSPGQELWMEKYLPQLKVGISQGVGGTFDVICGNVKRAPYIFRKLHLEWFYRLLKQPSRIFRQAALLKFMVNIVKDRSLRH